MNQIERDYREALDGLRFSGEAKRNMMNNLMERQEERPVKGKPFRPLRAGLIAAALCAALLGTAGAAQFFGVRIVDGAGGDDMAVWLEGGIVYYPYDSLSDEIKALGDQPESIKSFDSWQAMEDFIGVDLMNNPVLDASPAARYTVGYPSDYTVGCARGENRQIIRVRFLLITTPGLYCIRTHGCYEIGDVDIDVLSALYTDHKNSDWDEKFLGLSFPEGAETGRETYTAPSGLEVQIMEIDRVSGYRDSYLAAFSLNGVPFVVRTYSHNSLGEAREALFQVLDGFQP